MFSWILVPQILLHFYLEYRSIRYHQILLTSTQYVIVLSCEKLLSRCSRGFYYHRYCYACTLVHLYLEYRIIRYHRILLTSTQYVIVLSCEKLLSRCSRGFYYHRYCFYYHRYCYTSTQYVIVKNFLVDALVNFSTTDNFTLLFGIPYSDTFFSSC